MSIIGILLKLGVCVRTCVHFTVECPLVPTVITRLHRSTPAGHGTVHFWGEKGRRRHERTTACCSCSDVTPRAKLHQCLHHHRRRSGREEKTKNILYTRARHTHTHARTKRNDAVFVVVSADFCWNYP